MLSHQTPAQDGSVKQLGVGGSFFAHISRQELDDHAQDEDRPKDVQTLQHNQQPIEEVKPEERRVEGQGVHPRRVDDPGGGSGGGGGMGGGEHTETMDQNRGAQSELNLHGRVKKPIDMAKTKGAVMLRLIIGSS